MKSFYMTKHMTQVLWTAAFAVSAVALPLTVGMFATQNFAYSFDQAVSVMTQGLERYVHHVAPQVLSEYHSTSSYTQFSIEARLEQQMAQVANTVSSIAIGDRVRVIVANPATPLYSNSVEVVRTGPSTLKPILGVQYVGYTGKVVAGPVSAVSYIWWQVDFDNEPDGWVRAISLAKDIAPPSCTLTSDKTSYTLGEVITFSWASQNATYASWQQDTSGKDHLILPVDKLTASGSQAITANVIGNPAVTLLVGGSGGNGSCSMTVTIVPVAPQPSIMLQSPKQGEELKVGTPYRISWNYANLSQGKAVTFDVSEFTDFGKGLVGSITQGDYGCPDGTCTFIWTPHTVSSKYQIAVGQRGTNVIGYSEFFSVTAVTIPPITIVSPTKGETLQVNQAYKITWTDSVSDNLGDSYSLSYSYTPASGVPFQEKIAANLTVSQLQGTGSRCTGGYACAFTWTPQNAGTNASIHIDASHVNHAPSSGDSGNFTITPTVVSSITVLSPNGGEGWLKGTTQLIKWQDNIPYPPCSGSERGLVCVIAQRLYDITLDQYLPPCTGTICPAVVSLSWPIAKGISDPSYNWTVGQLPPTYTLGIYDGVYTMKVCQSGTNTCDSSDKPFTITTGSTQPWINITSPSANPAITIKPTTPLSVVWEENYNSNSLTISIYDANGKHFYDGKTPGVIGKNIQTLSPEATNLPDGSYGVAVVDHNTLDSYGHPVSSGVLFNISSNTAPQPSITVRSPNGGESYPSSGTVSFYGTMNYSPKKLVAYLYSSVNGNVAQLYPLYNQGSAGDFKGVFSGDPGIGMGQYKITVCDELTDSPQSPGKPLCDSSDNYFNVISDAPQPSITVLSPNIGEMWQRGSTQTIAWSAPSTISEVSIQMIHYGEYATFYNIATVPNTGSYNWLVEKGLIGATPYALPNGLYSIRIFGGGLDSTSKEQFRLTERPSAVTDSILTTSAANVRNGPSTIKSVAGTQAIGAKGKIIAGPVTAVSYTWWQVDFDSGVDGWVADVNLSKR